MPDAKIILYGENIHPDGVTVESTEDDITIGGTSGGKITFARAGGVAVSASHADGSIYFQTGGGVNRAHLTTAGYLGVGDLSATSMVGIQGNLTTNLSDSTSTVSGTGDRTVASDAHGLVAGAAVKDTGGNKFTVASVTDANTFVVDSDTAGNSIEGQWTTDPSPLKILTGDTGTPATALEFTNRRQLILADASSNICIGTSTTGDSLTSGSNNVFVGLNAGTAILNGNQNSVFGNQACRLGKTDNTQSTAIGYYALYAGGGGYNTAVGAHALAAASSGGSNNVAFGREAGDTITSGDENVCLGTGSDVTGTGAQNQIAIGYGAVAGVDDTCVIGNSDLDYLQLGSGNGQTAIGSAASNRTICAVHMRGRSIVSVEMGDLGQVNSTDTGKISQVEAHGASVIIPAYAIVTHVALTLEALSGADTHLAMVALSTVSGTSTDTALAGTVVELLGLGAAGTRSTTNTSAATDIDLTSTTGAVGKTWFNNGPIHNGGAASYLYVAQAGTGNTGTPGTTKAVITIEWTGLIT